MEPGRGTAALIIIASAIAAGLGLIVKGGETLAGIVIVIAVVIFLWRRGEGWRRTLAGAFIAWAVSSVFIVLWEIVSAFALRGYMIQQPRVVPSAVVTSDSSRVAKSSVSGSALYSPTPDRLPPTRTPVVPRVNFPTGTEILVDDFMSIPLRPRPSNDGRVEWSREGDRLVVTGEYVVNEEEFDTPQIWWPVSNPQTGKRGYLLDMFVDKDVIAGTNG